MKANVPDAFKLVYVENSFESMLSCSKDLLYVSSSSVIKSKGIFLAILVFTSLADC